MAHPESVAPPAECPVDHFVFVVPDLAEAIHYFKAEYGLEPIIGGRHLTLGTHNALLSLGGGAYFELLAIDPTNTEFAATERPYSFGLTPKIVIFPHVLTWAVRTENIEKSVEYESKQSGLAALPISAGSRILPTGAKLEWKITFPRFSLTLDDAEEVNIKKNMDHGPGFGIVPFLIDWLDTPKELHPSQTTPRGCKLVSVRIVTRSPHEVRSQLEHRRIDCATVSQCDSEDDEEVCVEIDTPNGKRALFGNWKRSLTFRKGTIEDEPFINNLYKGIKFFPCDGNSDEIIMAHVWGGKFAGVGRVGTTSDPHARELAGIFIEEPYRSRGLARMLVTLLVDKIKALPADIAVFCVPFKNLASFYAGFGFFQYDINSPDVPVSVAAKFKDCGSRFGDNVTLMRFQRS